MNTWIEVPPDHLFGVQCLPYGSFVVGPQGRPRVGVAIADCVLDLSAVAASLLPLDAPLFEAGTLDGFLAAGPQSWLRVRSAITQWFTDGNYRSIIEPALHPVTDVSLMLPFAVADYVDFYASEQHATNLGRILRPDGEPLPPNWKHLPIGYHGRAGTVVVSGTPVLRPHGQRRTTTGEVVFGVSQRLDIEVELGFVVGTPSELGKPVDLRDFDRHVFGVCLVNDWSARDIQAWEYQPLGPFLGKSFATSISGWVVPLAALDGARIDEPTRAPAVLPYLDDSTTPPAAFDISFEVYLNGHLISRPEFGGMYWTGAQMLAHLTSNGASLRTGDLYASGTVSGAAANTQGSLIELSWNGERPITLLDGSVRSFLEDGDEVLITASAVANNGGRIGLGEVRGVIVGPPQVAPRRSAGAAADPPEAEPG